MYKQGRFSFYFNRSNHMFWDKTREGEARPTMTDTNIAVRCIKSELSKIGIIWAREQKRYCGYIECNEKVAIPCKLNRCAQSKLFCWLGGPFELERWKIQGPGAAAARSSKQCVNDSISGVVTSASKSSIRRFVITEKARDCENRLWNRWTDLRHY